MQTIIVFVLLYKVGHYIRLTLPGMWPLVATGHARSQAKLAGLEIGEDEG